MYTMHIFLVKLESFRIFYFIRNNVIFYMLFSLTKVTLQNYIDTAIKLIIRNNAFLYVVQSYKSYTS